MTSNVKNKIDKLLEEFAGLEFNPLADMDTAEYTMASSRLSGIGMQSHAMRMMPTIQKFGLNDGLALATGEKGVGSDYYDAVDKLSTEKAKELISKGMVGPTETRLNLGFKWNGTELRQGPPTNEVAYFRNPTNQNLENYVKSPTIQQGADKDLELRKAAAKWVEEKHKNDVNSEQSQAKNARDSVEETIKKNSPVSKDAKPGALDWAADNAAYLGAGAAGLGGLGYAFAKRHKK